MLNSYLYYELICICLCSTIYIDLVVKSHNMLGNDMESLEFNLVKAIIGINLFQYSVGIARIVSRLSFEFSFQVERIHLCLRYSLLPILYDKF